MSKALAVKNLLEQALQFDREEQDRKWKEAHPDGKTFAHVSDHDDCFRKLWYSLRGYPETNPPDLNSLVNFALGHAAEEMFAGKMKAFGVKVLTEVRIEFPNGVSGRIDVAIFIPELNCLVELKTTGSRQFKFLPKGGRPEHRKQLRSYLLAGHMGLLEEHGILPEDCQDGTLCYIIKDATKNQPSIWTYDVPLDLESAQFDLLKLELMTKDALLEIDPPVRPEGFTQKKFPCAWCRYEQGCWSGQWS